MSTKPKATKRQRSVDKKRKFEDLYKIEEESIDRLKEKVTFPSNGEVIGFIYGSFKNLSLMKRCYPVAQKLLEFYKARKVILGVKVDRISQKIKGLLKDLQLIQKNLNIRMNPDLKIRNEHRFLSLTRELFSVGAIPAGLNRRQIQLIPRSSEQVFPEPDNIREEHQEYSDISMSLVNSGILHDGYDDTFFDSSLNDTNLRRPVNKKPKLTNDMLLSYDYTKISDRAVKVLLDEKHKEQGFQFSQATIRRNRMKARSDQANKIKESIASWKGPFGVQFDGKGLADIERNTSDKRYERLVILVKGRDKQQLIAVKKVAPATGKNIGITIVEALKELKIEPAYANYDTCSSNTGLEKGALVFVHDEFGDFLNMPCRLHIYELPLAAAVTNQFGPSTGPKVQGLSDLQALWKSLDHENLKLSDAKSYPLYKKYYKNDEQEIITFCQGQLLLQHNRDDYKELIQLILMFFGEMPIQIQKPGPISNARWLQKGIYALKLFLLRYELKLDRNYVTKLWNIICVLNKIYIFGFYTARLCHKAPNTDLLMLKRCHKLSVLNKELAKVVTKKIINHLDYLSEKLVLLALFDDDVPNEVKSRMVNKLSNPSDAKIITQDTDSKIFNSLSLDMFVGRDSQAFFDTLEIDTSFLSKPICLWDKEATFEEAKEIVASLISVNESAERAIKIADDYNGVLTEHWDQYEYLCINKYAFNNIRRQQGILK